MKKILSVSIKHLQDRAPDLSYLGEYSNTPEPCGIDRAELGHMRSHELRYFNPCNHTSLKDWEHLTDQEVRAAFLAEIDGKQPPGLSRNDMVLSLNAHYRFKDYERMEAYERGDWHMIGIRADAEIQLTGDLCQTITSGGLWGIESDSGADYLRQVAADQLAELKTELKAIGFNALTIAKAFHKAKDNP